jgi:hypothetical protein
VEVTNALLVAIMFVTLLAMGIGNILVSVAATVGSSRASRDRLHTSWRVLVLLIHFNLFWHTLDLLQVEDWAFGQFLFVIAGPILLFFATSVLIEGATAVEDDGPTLATARFFVLLALTQLWSFSTDFILRDGMSRAGMFNIAAMAILMITVARADRYRAQLAANGTFWVLVLLMLFLRGRGVIA